MKAFRVLIRKDRKEGQTHFLWPEWWSKYYDKVQIVAYQDEGQVDEWAVGYAEDDLADQMAEEGEEFQIIHPDFADFLASTWVPATEIIDDPQAVLRVTAKMARGERLTAEDRGVLDPNDPTPGIRHKPPRSVSREAGELRPEGYIPPESAAAIRKALKERGLR